MCTPHPQAIYYYSCRPMSIAANRCLLVLPLLVWRFGTGTYDDMMIGRPVVALVDHGTPSAAVNRVRNHVAEQLRTLLAEKDEAAAVVSVHCPPAHLPACPACLPACLAVCGSGVLIFPSHIISRRLASSYRRSPARWSVARVRNTISTTRYWRTSSHSRRWRRQTRRPPR